MPVTTPKAVRVRTSAGWVDIALVGPPGAPGANGTVVVYEQPNEPPAGAALGSVWIDTDAPTPAPADAAPFSYVNETVTVSVTAPAAAPSRDGILWVVVKP